MIEGFYGPPWTHAERLDLIELCGRHGLNTWVHAPKDDPFHRQRWRDPYPDDELEQLAELVRHADANGVEYVWALHPGMSIRAGEPKELDALDAKRDQLRGAGVRTFHLLWDDIERDFVSAEAQAAISNRFADGEPLVVCPMGYAGVDPTPYRETFGRALDPQIVCYWTGPEVVSKTITRDDLDEATAAFGHDLFLWDNYPVNDFAPTRLFLGPLTGRDPELVPGLKGVVANGMVQAVPSKLALATFADWARDPRSYDPLASFERALAAYGAEVLEALAVAPAPVAAPDDLPALVEALAPGVDAPTAAALLAPFV